MSDLIKKDEIKTYITFKKDIHREFRVDKVEPEERYRVIYYLPDKFGISTPFAYIEFRTKEELDKYWDLLKKSEPIFMED